MTPPRLLFVHAGAELYGADRILLELGAGLVQRGHAVHVVLPGPGPLVAELAAAGATVHQHNLGVLRRKYFSLQGLLNRACRLLRAVRFLRRLIREQRIEVVHSNTTAVFAGALAARLAGVPHVWHVHEITTRPLWFARLVARCVGWWADRAVFVSGATAQHMQQLHARLAERSLVIHNGIRTERATSGTRGRLRAECGWSATEVVVGMIGRINWWKGQGCLLDCAALLLPTHPALRFVLVGGSFAGEQTLQHALLQRVAQQGLAGRVVLQDFRPDIGHVLADIDVFVLPSTEPDPLPTVVLEAMAAGKPVVAFAHGGVCEMVQPEQTGLLVPPVDVPALAAAIARLGDSPAERERMGAAGRLRVAQQFTSAVFVDRFAALYRELSAQR